MTQHDTDWLATLLQLAQLFKATLDCKPDISTWPEMSPEFKLKFKSIYRDCNYLYSRLEAGMSAEQLEEFEDTNSDLYEFMKQYLTLTPEQRKALLLT